MDFEINKKNLFHKKFGFYLDNLILLNHDTIDNIQYYTNYNKIDLYKYNINKNEWFFICNGVKELEL
jgi:hypothetical protein